MTHTGGLEVKVKQVRRYKTFEEMLQVEPWARIVPEARSNEEVLSLLKRIYPPEKERLGVVVLEFVRTSQQT